MNPFKCKVCNEVIYHPICPSCLSDGMEKWLENTNKETMAKFLEKKPTLLSHVKGNSRCVVCGSHHYSACPYCFSEIMLRWINKHEPALAPKYLEIFNFDFNKTGYMSNHLFSQQIMPDEEL